jgi:hypothetical protein
MSILQGLLNVAMTFCKSIIVKPKLTHILMLLVKFIPDVIASVGQIGGMSDKEKVDDALASFDAVTGIDEGAFDLLKDLPPDIEEQFMDHFKEIVRILAYNRLEVDGYFVAEPVVEEPGT